MSLYRSQVVMMCKTKRSADATLPAVIGTVVLVSAVGSAAAAIVASVALAVLTAVGVLSAIGVVVLVMLLRSGQPGLYRPAPRPARVRQAAAAPALPAPRRILALAVPPVLPARTRLAIEAPATVPAADALAGALVGPAAEEELITLHT
jgi:hypothetical protein